jgi:hypothetical protein
MVVAGVLNLAAISTTTTIAAIEALVHPKDPILGLINWYIMFFDVSNGCAF